jgi:hypothetical protein
MGKASELDDFLDRQPPLTPEEIEARDGPRPKLRLGSHLLNRSLGPDAKTGDVLDRLTSETKVTSLHDSETGATGVVVPAEQYLELVTSYIRDRGLAEVKLDGQVAPTDTTLLDLGVEQVNPRDTWLRIEGYEPRPPAPAS